jgi:hydroxyacylglutathione hydrolase
VVYPGHGAGSPCGKKIGDAARTTIGQEKRFNYAFQTPSRTAFIEAVMTGMPKPPAYYPAMKRVNAAGPVLLSDLPTGDALSADEVAARQEAGAILIDARDAGAFAAGHIPGSVNIGLGPSFAIWAGWLTPYDRDVILILPRDAAYAEALTELRRVGIDAVAGFLRGGLDTWVASGRPVEALREIPVAELAARHSAKSNGLSVIDVRDETEWATGHIPGARNLPAGVLAQGATAGADRDAPVALICGSGYRSAVAASLLQRQGYREVIAVPGGMSAWVASGLPTTASSYKQ